MGRLQTLFSIFVLTIAAGLSMTWLQNRASVAGGGLSELDESCPRAMAEVCGPYENVPGPIDQVVLSSTAVCVDVGYLCADVEKADSLRILRWPKDTERIRIRVPLPTGMTPERARALQSAAVRGIQYWHRNPFDLVIDTHPTPSGTPDIEIAWGEGLTRSQLGFTRVRWSVENGRTKFEVLGLSLATHSPADPRYEIPAEQVLLTAAHEMGHALGLPHSDSERDVMFPTNKARGLSNRDFRTVDALYRLPNGAVIGKDG